MSIFEGCSMAESVVFVQFLLLTMAAEIWGLLVVFILLSVLAVQTLRNNIMASTLLASTAIMLSSLIAALMASSGTKDGLLGFVLGDRSKLATSIKFFSILVCFLVAFLMNVQSIRYYSHASILINVPYKKISNYAHTDGYRLTAEYVANMVNRGSYFWSLGLRAFYFSFPLFLWLFGPIPMFICCVVLVFLLYFLDFTFDLGWISSVDNTLCDEEIGSLPAIASEG